MGAQTRQTILIVEDDEGIAELERLRLEEAGYAATAVSTAAAALEKLAAGGIDLILLDYRLPDAPDGLEFYARARAAGYDPPVVLVTGFSDEMTIIRALRAGARDFVTKSAQYLDYLPEAVGRVLSQVGTERQLAESEARFRSLVSSMDDLVFTLDRDQRYTGVYGRGANIPGLAPGRLLGFTAREAFGPAGAEIHEEAAARALAGARVLYEWSYPSPDGDRWIQTSLSPVRANGGAVTGAVGVGRDVTEQKRTQEALRRSEEGYRSFVETTNEWVWVCDQAGRMVYNNPAVFDLLGYTPAELDGTDTLALIHPDDRLVAAEMLARSIAERHGWTGNVFRWQHRDGSIRHLESNSVPTFDALGQLTGFQGADRDITDRLTLEAELRQAQKMEAIGRLAGGVAHDFNNLLTVINGYSELLLGDASLDPNGRDLVAEIARAGDQASALTRQLLAFSRKQVLTPRVLDPNALVKEMERMLTRLIGADVSLSSSLDPDLGKVKADPGQLEQVLLNLVVNARDAMPEGGHLTIETRNVDLDPEYTALATGVQPGPYVLLAVTDTGVGMTAEVKAKIFEPFFTTKDPGKGTGLGLSTVHGIVEQSGGHVDVYSEPGRGTTFKVYLPRLTEGETPSALSEGWQKVPRGTETILLADDDPGVRALSRLALQSYGYTVLEAADGDEAIRLGLECPPPLHLLVTDLVMPRAGGREVAEKVQPVHPEARVLFLSGYTDDALVRHGVLEAGVAFLHKPFTPTTLARKVREVLDAETASRWG